MLKDEHYRDFNQAVKKSITLICSLRPSELIHDDYRHDFVSKITLLSQLSHMGKHKGAKPQALEPGLNCTAINCFI